MRIEQILLFREDVRELFDLTIGKMENYLVVNTLTLAFSMGFYYEGRMPHDTPSWLFWLWGMSLATAILFLIMSVWFAIYASITAQTFAVRLLTQWLRLPVPSLDDITAAAPTAADYEKLNSGALLRVPVVSTSTQSKLIDSSKTAAASSSAAPPGRISPQGGMRRSRSAGDVADRATEEQESFPEMINPALEEMFARDYATFVEHFHLFRYLQENWAGYDAYARVCMVVGSAQLIAVIGYMGLAWYISDRSRWGGAVFTVMLIVFGLVHARTNLLLSRKELVFLAFFQIAGPILGCAASVLHYMDNAAVYGRVIAYLAPVAFAFHLFTITFYLALGSERNGALPTKYATVVSIDVLGLWEEDKVTEDEEEAGDEWDAMRATSRALTGWQKKWLKATKREAPVSALIPQSIDVTLAERARHLRPRGSDRVFNRNAASSADNVVAAPELAPTLYTKTLPWVTFRQAGAVTILLWAIAVGVGTTVAVRGDIPGWDSDPSAHQGVAGVALWQPQTFVASNSQSRMKASPIAGGGNVIPILPSVSNGDLRIGSVRGVTKQGLHVTAGYPASRFLIEHSLAGGNVMTAYADREELADFANVTAQEVMLITSLPRHRAPWCGPSDVVTMVEPNEFRDCNDLRHRWTVSESAFFRSSVGRYALSATEIFKFQYQKASSSLRTEMRLPLPPGLDNAVDIAKNDFLMAALTRDGLLALWTTHHAEVPRRGIRKLPITGFLWKGIVGAGGRSFVILGEHTHTAAAELFFVNDVLLLQRPARDAPSPPPQSTPAP